MKKEDLIGREFVRTSTITGGTCGGVVYGVFSKQIRTKEHEFPVVKTVIYIRSNNNNLYRIEECAFGEFVGLKDSVKEWLAKLW